MVRTSSSSLHESSLPIQQDNFVDSSVEHRQIEQDLITAKLWNKLQALQLSVAVQAWLKEKTSMQGNHQKTPDKLIQKEKEKTHQEIVQMAFDQIFATYGKEKWLDIIREHIVIELNTYRKSHDMPLLSLDPVLTTVSQKFATYGAPYKQLGHSFDGKSYKDMWVSLDTFSATGENVAYGADSIAALLDGRYKSPWHKETMVWRWKSKYSSQILTFDSIGIGLQWPFVVADFGIAKHTAQMWEAKQEVLPNFSKEDKQIQHKLIAAMTDIFLIKYLPSSKTFDVVDAYVQWKSSNPSAMDWLAIYVKEKYNSSLSIFEDMLKQYLHPYILSEDTLHTSSSLDARTLLNRLMARSCINSWFTVWYSLSVTGEEKKAFDLFYKEAFDKVAYNKNVILNAQKRRAKHQKFDRDAVIQSLDALKTFQLFERFLWTHDEELDKMLHITF